MAAVNSYTPELRALCDRATLKGKDIVALYSPKAGGSVEFTPEMRHAAKAIREACAIWPATDTIDRAAATLPPEIFTAVMLVCGACLGFTVAEETVGVPSRSGKLLVAIGLRELTRKRIVR